MEPKQDTLKVDSIAFKKIVFHCLRYPSSKVYGKPPLTQAPWSATAKPTR